MQVLLPFINLIIEEILPLEIQLLLIKQVRQSPSLGKPPSGTLLLQVFILLCLLTKKGVRIAVSYGLDDNFNDNILANGVDIGLEGLLGFLHVIIRNSQL